MIIKQADISIGRWDWWTCTWDCRWYYENDPKVHHAWGSTFTIWGARIRAIRAMHGILAKRNSYYQVS